MNGKGCEGCASRSPQRQILQGVIPPRLGDIDFKACDTTVSACMRKALEGMAILFDCSEFFAFEMVSKGSWAPTMIELDPRITKITSSVHNKRSKALAKDLEKIKKVDNAEDGWRVHEAGREGQVLIISL